MEYYSHVSLPSYSRTQKLSLPGSPAAMARLGRLKSFHLTLKPVGARCNLACDYCYYMHNQGRCAEGGVMSEEVLRSLVERYIHGQEADRVEFTWQGGEPTLAGASD